MPIFSGPISAATQAALDAKANKGALVFNVKDYGAVGNGTTDDATAVQAAIDACAAAGGSVWFPVGTYLCGTTLTLKSAVHLRGVGPGGDVFSNTDGLLPFQGSVIKLKSGANVDLIKTNNFATLTGTATPSAYTTPNRFGIYDLVLDGNKTGNTTGRCLVIYGRSYWLQNLVVQNGPTGGIYCEYGTSAGYDNEAQFINLRVTDNGAYGIDFQGPHDSLMTNVFSARNATFGLRVGANSGSMLCTNVHNWGNGTYNFISASTDASFVNCVSDGAGGSTTNTNGAGIQLLSSGTRWFGGSIYGTNTPGEVLLQLGDGTGTYTVQGCDFNTRWFSVALGAVPIQVMNTVTESYNQFVGKLLSGTNNRYVAGNGRTAISGGSVALPAGTLTVTDTTSFPTSGTLYTYNGSASVTINYTGKTATTFTGCTGGSGTLANGAALLNTSSLHASTTTLMPAGDGNGPGGLLIGGSNVANVTLFDNQARVQNAAFLIKSPTTTTQTLASNGAVTIDAASGSKTRITLNANATSSTISNPTVHELLTVTWIQDATGGRTYAWPTNCKFAAGTAPADTTASKRTSVTFEYDGTNWNEVSRAVAVG